MKQYSFLLVSFLLVIALSLSCKKDKPELPPATTAGANTFGCKIDGRIFVPRDDWNKIGLYPQYAYMGEGEGGGWFLGIPAVDWKHPQNESVGIATDSLLVEEGMTYEFKNKKGYPQAYYFKTRKYLKLDSDIGKLHITRFDKINRILSGTFEFVGTEPNSGEIVTISEGRFDIVY